MLLSDQSYLLIAFQYDNLVPFFLSFSVTATYFQILPI